MTPNDPFDPLDPLDRPPLHGLTSDEHGHVFTPLGNDMLGSAHGETLHRVDAHTFISTDGKIYKVDEGGLLWGSDGSVLGRGSGA